MENRIQINGVWYTREDNQPTQELKPLNREDVTAFKGFVYDTNGFSYEATKIAKSGLFEEGEYYDDFDIKFTNMHTTPHTVEHWDSMFWFRGVLENNPDSINALVNESEIDHEDILEFRSFLAFLKQEGWL
jgi:hypothetical protein